MNQNASQLRRSIAADIVAYGGLQGYQQHNLKHLELKTVVKESHCSPITNLCFNLHEDSLNNLFATVGKDHATVYDDTHMGDYVSVVVNYVNSETKHHAGGELNTCCWVQVKSVSAHTKGEACLAVAGPDGTIHIVSIAESRVVALLKGHQGEVVDMSGATQVPGLLLSLGKDGCVRLWDVARQHCLVAIETDAFTAELSPCGTFFLTGHKAGRIARWALDISVRTQAASVNNASGSNDDGSGESTSAAAAATSHHARPLGSSRWLPQCLGLTGTPTKELLTLPGLTLGDTIDCIRFVPSSSSASAGQQQGDRLSGSGSGSKESDEAMFDAVAGSSGVGVDAGAAAGSTRFAAKGCDGRLCVWDLGSSKQVCGLRVPGGAGIASHKGRCLFSVTSDGGYICTGNHNGDVYVFDATTGTRAVQVNMKKVNGPVRSAVLSTDCRHLLAVAGNGFIFRFESIKALSGLTPNNNAGPQQPDSKEDGHEGTAADGAAVTNTTGKASAPRSGMSGAAAAPAAKKQKPNSGAGGKKAAGKDGKAQADAGPAATNTGGGCGDGGADIVNTDAFADPDADADMEDNA